MPKLKIYTRRFCPFCTRALATLEQAGIKTFEEVPIDGREGPLRRELMELTGGRWDVPQVFIDEAYIGDDDALEALARSGELGRRMGQEADRN